MISVVTIHGMMSMMTGGKMHNVFSLQWVLALQIKVDNQFREADTKEYIIYDMQFHWLFYALNPMETAQARFLPDWKLLPDTDVK